MVSTGTFSATRLRTQKQIEEQQEREKKEREEKEARENVRGEWSLTLQAGPQTVKGVALITTEANSKNEFASSGALFESVVPGTFSGTLEDGEASVTVTTMAAGPYPAATFTGKNLVVASTDTSMSIAGSGELEFTPGGATKATLTATRTSTYQELVAREAKEAEAKEIQEKEAQEAKEKQEREARERVAREAQEKTVREAQEKTAREIKERQEREAREAIAKVTATKTPALVSVQLDTKSSTVGAAELVSLQIANPNPYAISGRVTLSMTPSGKGGKSAGEGGTAGKKEVSFGTASFGISPDGKQIVKLKLSKVGRSELAHHGTVRVVATITTLASGQTTTTKTFGLTLHLAKATGGRH